MSQAFVREREGGEAFEDLPDRPVSPHTNFVTPEGLVGALVFRSSERGDGAIYLDAVVGDRHFWGTREGWTSDPGVARLARRWLVALIDADFAERYAEPA